MTLEDELRRGAGDGSLTHLLLVRTPQGWQASFGVGGNSYRVVVKDDPVEAVWGALRPKACKAAEQDGGIFG